MATKRKSKTIRIPLMPLRGLMIFPHMVLHFDVGRPRSIAALEATMLEGQQIFLSAQKDGEVENPTAEDICRVGTIALIKQVLNLPGDSLRVLARCSNPSCRRIPIGWPTSPPLSTKRRRMIPRCWHWCGQRTSCLRNMPAPACAYRPRRLNPSAMWKRPISWLM